MAPGRVDTEPSSEELLSRPRVAEARPEPGRTPLERLARGARLLAIAAAAGALAAGAVAALRPARYRAVARVLVVEPRLGSGPTVDFNLTPVRSYAALLTSPSLLAACGSAGLAGRLPARLPQPTRVL